MLHIVNSHLSEIIIVTNPIAPIIINVDPNHQGNNPKTARKIPPIIPIKEAKAKALLLPNLNVAKKVITINVNNPINQKAPVVTS